MFPGLGCAAFLCQSIPLLPGPKAFESVAALLLQGSILIVLPLVGAIVYWPLLFVLAFVRRNRRSLEQLLLCTGIVASILAAIISSGAFRKYRFGSVAERAIPAIQQLQAHYARTGEYPETFVLPSTGLMAYPRFNYRRSSKQPEDLDERRAFEGFELAVACPLGFLNWDRFVYWPSKTYPSHMYGGNVERIGDWAYVHE